MPPMNLSSHCPKEKFKVPQKDNDKKKIEKVI